MTPEFIGMIGLGAVVLAILLINDRQKERIVRRSESEGRKPPRGYLDYKPQARAIFVVAFVSVTMAFLISGKDNAQPSPTSPVSQNEYFGRTCLLVVLVSLLALAVVVVSLVAFQRWSNRDRLRAFRRAQAGDIDGAAEQLERLLEKNPPSATLLNDLAVIRSLQKRWDEMLQLLEAAETYPDWKPHMLTNKGCALQNLGRLTEALPLVEEASRQLPNDLVATCNYGTILVELGRSDEALKLLRQADHLFATQPGGGSRNLRCREMALEEFRQKVARRTLS